MEKARYNIFNLIHKALRSMLYETANLIQQTDFECREEAEHTMYLLEKILYYFDKHAQHEDTFILPAIARYNKELVDSFENEHVADHALAESIRESMEAWEKTNDPAEMIALGRHIFLTFNDFIAFNLTHMNKEEDELNAVLWEYFSDPELMQITQSLVATIPAEDLFDQSKRMMGAGNNQELLAWLSGIKQKAPKPLFDLHIRMAREVLSTKRWNAISEVLLADATVVY
ncbi:hemerythrin domain-containing protein [Paraflavitalea sp. CAU 1676]|uniref:hemerythrin domain-containing protein n=1 Tax=Paraflavitalea sp. CAU 1676 TaxID=3032598 RepID=UPI0023DB8D0D|nr:hemerythrin domain-containing protein [Paraflavitalea sp. CAU 1676]MDF2191851.1 hemerythrin domain-containing protein [Paraflavitalea sp. CAU 1676]